MSHQHDTFVSHLAIPKNSGPALGKSLPRHETLTVCKTAELVAGLLNEN